jgi:8-oxo-dGTP diphosphatase
MSSTGNQHDNPQLLAKIESFLGAGLTISIQPKTIRPEVYYMSRKPPIHPETQLLPHGGAVVESAANSPLQSEGSSKSVLQSKTHKSVTVVCACIVREGGQQVLLSMRRAPEVAGLDGKWELPGGKIEFGETPEQAIVREIREELGIRVVPRRLLPYLHTNLWEYAHAVQHVVLACYECELEEGVSYIDREDAKWFHINQIDFGLTLPGTREFVGLAAKNEWFDNIYIEFEFADPATNASKWFTVTTQPTLYSRYGLVKYWGRLGVSPTSKIEEFASPKQLDVRIFETAKRRLSEGYHICAFKGPERPYEVLARIIELAKEKNEYRPAVDDN